MKTRILPRVRRALVDRLTIVGLLGSLALPVGGAAQEPVPPPDRTEIDSLRAQLERASREQAAEIQRIVEARRSEMDVTREELERAMRAGREELEVMMRSLQEELARVSEVERQRLLESQEQMAAAMREMEAARLETARALQEELAARQQLLRASPPPGGASRALPGQGSGLIRQGGVSLAPGGRASSVADSARGMLRYSLADSAAYSAARGVLLYSLADSTIARGALLPTWASSPLLIGQRFVAGVQMTPINPSLARYFGVDSGVLVTEVADRSPGAEAGLLPGDVVVAVGERTVARVPEVREAFALRARDQSEPGGIPLRVIRDGEALELRVPEAP